MTETREFPTAVIASISSGVLLCDFGKMHEAAEYLMGHPIWTHHFGSKDLWKEMQATVLEQCPSMPTDLPDTTPDNYRAQLAALEADIGATQIIRKGGGLTAMLPTDGIPDHMKVVTIKTS